MLKRLFEKVSKLLEALNDETIHGEAAKILSAIIESVMIYAEGEHGAEAEIVAKVADMIA